MINGFIKISKMKKIIARSRTVFNILTPEIKQTLLWKISPLWIVVIKGNFDYKLLEHRQTITVECYSE